MSVSKLLAMVVAILIGTSSAQEGWNIVSKTTSGTIPLASSSYVDVLPFYNALGAPPQDVCKAINMALLSVTATGSTTGAVTIDARGVPLYNSGVGTSYLQCLTNPFAGTAAKGTTESCCWVKVR